MLEMISALFADSFKDQLQVTFDLFDASNNGVLSMPELRALVRQVRESNNQQAFTDEQFDLFVFSIDKDNSGSIRCVTSLLPPKHCRRCCGAHLYPPHPRRETLRARCRPAQIQL